MTARMETLANELSDLFDKIRDEGFTVLGIDAVDYVYIDLSSGEYRTPVTSVLVVPQSEAPQYSPISLWGAP